MSNAVVEGWLQRAPPSIRDASLRAQLEHVVTQSREACVDALRKLANAQEELAFCAFWQSVLQERGAAIRASQLRSEPQRAAAPRCSRANRRAAPRSGGRRLRKDRRDGGPRPAHPRLGRAARVGAGAHLHARSGDGDPRAADRLCGRPRGKGAARRHLPLARALHLQTRTTTPAPPTSSRPAYRGVRCASLVALGTSGAKLWGRLGLTPCAAWTLLPRTSSRPSRAL